MTDTPKYEIHVDKAYVSPKSAADLLKEAHEAIDEAMAFTYEHADNECSDTVQKEADARAHAALDSAVEAATREADADHEWRRQMEAYGYDSVGKVMDLIEAARVEERLRCETHRADVPGLEQAAFRRGYEQGLNMKQLSSCTFHDSLVEAARNEGEMVAARAIVIKADQEREAAFRRGARTALGMAIAETDEGLVSVQRMLRGLLADYADSQPEENKKSVADSSAIASHDRGPK